jgi:RNA polymerase sigma-70 factor, ECF subfamily
MGSEALKAPLKLVRGEATPAANTAGADDNALRRLARTDRSRAYELIVRRHREPLFHHAAYILRDWQEAIDVTQEVFIKAMREPRFFDADFNRKAWLYRVTSNLCFNMVRDRRRRSAILETVPRDEPANDPIEFVFQTQQQERILAAVDRVSEDHREVLMLRYYSDLSYAEISDTLSVKLGTVMSRLSRARAALLEALDALGVEQA